MGSLWTVALVMASVLLLGIGIIALVGLLDRDVEEQTDGGDDPARWVNIV